MTTERQPIDQLFKDKLGNFEKNPPFGLLSQIRQEVALRERAARVRRLRTVVSIAATIMLIMMAGWFTLDQPAQVADNRVQHPATSAVQQEKHPLRVTTSVPEQLLPVPSDAKTAVTADKQKHYASRVTTRPSGKQSAQPVPATVTQQSGSTTGSGQQVARLQDDKSAQTQQKQDFSGAGKQETGKQNNLNRDWTGKGSTQTTRATGNSLRQWSLKAELAQTFATMMNNASTGTDSRSQAAIGGGMIASLKVNDRVTLSTGVRFSQIRQGTHSTYTLAQTAGITYLQAIEKKGNITRDVSLYLPATSSIVYSSGMATNPQNIFVSDLAQSIQYLEVPIQAGYKLLSNNKMSLGVNGGLSTNFLVGNRATITENGIMLSQGSTDNIRDVLYAGSAGVEFGYDLGKNLVLTVEPRFKQYLHSVSSNDLVNVRPMQLGIFTGIVYSFH